MAEYILKSSPILEADGTPLEVVGELIRCKDCKHCDWDIIDIPYGLTRHIVWCCFRFKENGENVEVSPNDFCSKAERKVSSNFE